MASFLKGFDEYWRATADTQRKLVEPKPKAVIIPYKARQPTEEKVESSDFINERAYILASDMNLPLQWAAAVVKLRAMQRPKSIPKNSWQDIKAACEQLYADDFGLLKLIINHDWSLEDIYGCHPIAPTFRFDATGLLLLFHDDEVVGVNQQRIKIRRKSGNTLNFTRGFKPSREIILLHELK